MAKTFHCRPSDIAGLDRTGIPEHDQQREYFLDRAVYRYGSALENDMREAENSAKNDTGRAAQRSRVFARWMNDTDGIPSTVGRFRDPARRSE